MSLEMSITTDFEPSVISCPRFFAILAKILFLSIYVLWAFLFAATIVFPIAYPASLKPPTSILDILCLILHVSLAGTLLAPSVLPYTSAAYRGSRRFRQSVPLASCLLSHAYLLLNFFVVLDLQWNPPSMEGAKGEGEGEEETTVFSISCPHSMEWNPCSARKHFYVQRYALGILSMGISVVTSLCLLFPSAESAEKQKLMVLKTNLTECKQELRETTSKLKKLEEAKMFGDPDQCPICLDQPVTTVTNCRHMFCEDCMRAIYAEHAGCCPLCRSTVFKTRKLCLMILDRSSYEKY